MSVDTESIKKLLDDPDIFLGYELIVEFFIIAQLSRR